MKKRDWKNDSMNDKWNFESEGEYKDRSGWLYWIIFGFCLFILGELIYLIQVK